MKDKLWQVMLNMLRVESIRYSAISVRNLCKDADVHHTTFYYHFEDKEQLLRYGIETLLKGYFDIPLDRRFIEPFTVSELYYQGSDLSSLIASQRYDYECSQLITRWSKELMVKEAELFLKKAHLASNNGLAAIQLVETIFTISFWSEKTTLTLEELDKTYQAYVEPILLNTECQFK